MVLGEGDAQAVVGNVDLEGYPGRRVLGGQEGKVSGDQQC
jgi:hypothetical protein